MTTASVAPETQPEAHADARRGLKALAAVVMCLALLVTVTVVKHARRGTIALGSSPEAAPVTVLGLDVRRQAPHVVAVPAVAQVAAAPPPADALASASAGAAAASVVGSSAPPGAPSSAPRQPAPAPAGRSDGKARPASPPSAAGPATTTGPAAGSPAGASQPGQPARPAQPAAQPAPPATTNGPSAPVIASFTADPGQPSAGQPVTFEWSAGDDDGLLRGYDVSFGDGSTASGGFPDRCAPNPSDPVGPRPSFNHTYQQAGTYKVVLRVYSSGACGAGPVQSATSELTLQVALIAVGPVTPVTPARMIQL